MLLANQPFDAGRDALVAHAVILRWLRSRDPLRARTHRRARRRPDGGARRALAATGLRAGAGRADITPPTGYPLLGWARGDARAGGQHTRLFARAIVLQRGSRPVALVAADLNMIAGGLAAQAARHAGFDPRDVILSASHTHAGPTGYSNFRFKDAAFPTPKAPDSGVSEPDPLLYTFLVRRLALVLERARADLAPAVAGWGQTRLAGLTANRSLEAHLADHGLASSAVTDGPARTLTALPTDRPQRGRAARGPAGGRPAGAARRGVTFRDQAPSTTRRSRTTTPTTTAARRGSSSRPCAARHVPPGGRWSTSTATATPGTSPPG